MRIPKLKISPLWPMAGAALILGIGVAWLVMHTLKTREAAAAAALRERLQKHQVEVVVPTRDLKAGAIANSSDMAARPVPHSVIYPSTVTAALWAQYDGRTLTHPVYRGRPLLARDFGPVAHRSFAGMLAPGQRALTIDVSGVNSIAGLLQPGNRVDIMLLTRGPGGAQELPLLRHIRILATGGRTQPMPLRTDTGIADPDAGYGSVTLAVTPDQAARLALAERVGQLRIALLPQQTPDGGPLPHLLKGALFGQAAGGGPALPTVQYIIGGQGQNQVARVPLAAAPPSAGAPPPAGPQAAIAAQQQELATLKRLLHAAAQAPAPQPAPTLPKGYP